LNPKLLTISLIASCLLLFRGNAAGQSFYAFLQSDEDEHEICAGESVEARVSFWGGYPPYTVEISGEDGVYMVFEDVESSFNFNITPEADDNFYISSVTDSRGKKGRPYGNVEVIVHIATPVTLLVEPLAFLENDPPIELNSSPDGAEFSGQGVKGDMFDPGAATAEGSPHRIRAAYTNEFGCISTDHEDVFVLYGTSEVALLAGETPVQVICGEGSSYTIRGSNQDGMAGNFELYNALTGNRITGHITDPDPDDNQASLDATGLEGSYYIEYIYGIHELEIRASVEFQVTDIRVTGIAGLPDTVCRDNSPFNLAPEVDPPDPEGIYQISGPGISGNQSDGYVFVPRSPGVPEGVVTIKLEFASSAGCNSVIDQQVFVGGDPGVDFDIGEHCIENGGSEISFINLTSDPGVVEEWTWDFGDPESGPENTSSLEAPLHFYGEAGPRSIRLTATTNAGCSYSRQKDTLLVDVPETAITWSGDCFYGTLPVEFIPSFGSVYSEVDSLLWLIQTGDNEVLALIGREPGAGTVSYIFPESGTYKISLLAENEAGCSGVHSEQFILRPVHQVVPDGFLETFSGTPEGWSANSGQDSFSWILGTPDFYGFNPGGTGQAWYTDLPDETGGPSEDSWVSSPCFDISDLRYPVIELDVMKSFVPGESGAVMQVAGPEGTDWTNVGTLLSGRNWYNDSAIRLEPGSSPVGWSLHDFHPDSVWVRAEHLLDREAGGSIVKFRIAFASNGRQELEPGRFNQGFAFDNFTLRERAIRHSVLEYFTNISGPLIDPADSAVAQYASLHSGRLFDLHFHMDTPMPDPLNSQNPGPPGTRSFHYGIPTVPYAVLNGGATGEYRFDLSENPVLEDQPLYKSSGEVPLFDLSVEADFHEDHLEGTVTVTCLDQAYDTYVQLYVVILEKEVTLYPDLSADSAFRNVVLDMVPSPAGTLIDQSWQPGQVRFYDFYWEYAEFLEDIEDLSVVSYIQERDEGWILQAGESSFKFGVGIQEPPAGTKALAIFPNPATSSIRIRLGQAPAARGRLSVTDLSGRELMIEPTRSGENEYLMNVGQLPRGLYLLRWQQAGKIMGTGKFIIN